MNYLFRQVGRFVDICARLYRESVGASAFPKRDFKEEEDFCSCLHGGPVEKKDSSGRLKIGGDDLFK